MVTAVYLDADTCATRLEEALSRLGIVAVFGTRELPQGASDEAQLARATELGHPILTGNSADFARLNSQIAAEGRGHAGIIIRTGRNRSFEALAEALVSLCTLHTNDSMRNLVHWI